MAANKNEEIIDDRSWIPYPREIYSLFFNGGISSSEYLIYMFIRHSADIYGKSSVSLEMVRSSLSLKIGKNAVNRCLINLKNQKLLWYKNRRGSAKPFSVFFPWFFPHDGKITTIQPFFDDPIKHDNPKPAVVLRSEHVGEVKRRNQNLLQAGKEVTRMKESIGNNSKFRSAYTDTNTNIKNIDNVNSDKGEEILVDSFEPNGYEESQCLEIARALGEKDMRFLLSLYRKGYFWAIERAWGVFREIDKSKPENPAAYFNSMVTKLIAEKQQNTAQ
jgi:hypothetical protein